MAKISPVTLGVWRAVEDLIAELGYSPSFREIGDKAHLSVSNVSHHLELLMAGGVLSMEANRPRSIRLLGRLDRSQVERDVRSGKLELARRLD